MDILTHDCLFYILKEFQGYMNCFILSLVCKRFYRAMKEIKRIGYISLYPRVSEEIKNGRKSSFFLKYLSKEAIDIELFYRSNFFTEEMLEVVGSERFHYLASSKISLSKYKYFDAFYLSGAFPDKLTNCKNTRIYYVYAKYSKSWNSYDNYITNALRYCRGETYDVYSLILYPEFNFLKNSPRMGEFLLDYLSNSEIHKANELLKRLFTSFSSNEKDEALRQLKILEKIFVRVSFLHNWHTEILELDAALYEIRLRVNERQTVMLLNTLMFEKERERNIGLFLLKKKEIRDMFRDTRVMRYLRNGRLSVTRRDILECEIHDIPHLLKLKSSLKYTALLRADLSNIYYIINLPYDEGKLKRIEDRVNKDVLEIIRIYE